MTPEQRFDRMEYILGRLVKSGREARTEFRQKINILIKSHLETEEIMKGLALGQARLDHEMAELANSQRITDQAMAELAKGHARLKQEMAEGQARLQEEMAELAKSQRLTDQALRAFINNSRRGGNGESSN